MLGKIYKAINDSNFESLNLNLNFKYRYCLNHDLSFTQPPRRKMLRRNVIYYFY